MKLKRLFKRDGKDDDSQSDCSHEMKSDTAEPDPSDAGTAKELDSHSDHEWGDWSMSEEQLSRDDEDDDIYVPLKGAASAIPLAGATGSDNEAPPKKSRPKPSREYRSMSDMRHLKGVEPGSPKKGKKKKKKGTKEMDDSVRGRKKKSKSVPVISPSPSLEEQEGASLEAGAAVGEGSTQSFSSVGKPASDTKLAGDDGSVKSSKSNRSSGKSGKEKKKKKKKEKKKKTKAEPPGPHVNPGDADDLEVSTSTHRRRKSKRTSEKDSETESLVSADQASLGQESVEVNQQETPTEIETVPKDMDGESTEGVAGVASPPSFEEEKKDGVEESSRPQETVPQDAEQPEMSLSTSLLPPSAQVEEVTAEELKGADNDDQRQEILRLQQQLSDALQKVVAQSAEQIQDKDQFLRVSTELSMLKANYENVNKEKEDLKERLGEREEKTEASMARIGKLEEAIERQLDEQDRLESKLEQSEDEIEKLLIEIQDLERAAEHSLGGGGEDEELRSDLKESKKTLIDKQRQIDDQRSRIEHLNKELQDSATVNKLQVDELEEEKKALQGKLKGERLELASKLSRREESISALEKELKRYRGDSEAQDLASTRDALQSTKEELETVREEAEVSQDMLLKVRSDKDDLIERNSVLNEQIKVLQKNVTELMARTKDLDEKVLKWTEQTYEWKSRAEAAEKKVEHLADGSEIGSDGGSGDEAPQGLFLQAVMDRKDASKKIGGRWSLFGGTRSEAEELSPDEIRIKSMEERNQALDATIAELRSELVKAKSTHRDEIYASQKKVAQLQGENEALTLQNATLEQICAEKK